MFIRTDKRGELAPPLHPYVSGHRSYKIAVRRAKRRADKTGDLMAVITWHDEKAVVMPAWIARDYDEADLLVDFV